MNSDYVKGDQHIKNLEKTVKEMLVFIMDCNREQMTIGKTECVKIAFGEGNYAFGLGVVNCLIVTGYLREQQGEVNRYMLVTFKGVRYAKDI